MARPDASAARTRQLLDAAVAVFARRGLHQARIEDIAVEAGLSKGLVYRYFADKDALIVALVDDVYGEALAHLRTVVDMDGPVADHLARFTDQLGATVERMAPLLPVTFEFYVAALRRPDVRRILERYHAAYRAAAHALVQRGIERGEFRARSAEHTQSALVARGEGTYPQVGADEPGVGRVRGGPLPVAPQRGRGQPELPADVGDNRLRQRRRDGDNRISSSVQAFNFF